MSYHQSFDPFGLPETTGTSEFTRVGFTGQEHDNDLGLIDMKGRIYDPLAGRFASADPITQAPYWSQGLNRYSYVFNNPVNNTDPSGFVVDGLGYLGGSGSSVGGSGLGSASGSGFLPNFGLSILGSAANIGISLLGGGYGGGSKGGTFDASPSGRPAGNGVSQESPKAQTQNTGGVSELARPPGTSLFDPARGALAQNFQPGGYCHEDGPVTTSYRSCRSGWLATCSTKLQTR